MTVLTPCRTADVVVDLPSVSILPPPASLRIGGRSVMLPLGSVIVEDASVEDPGAHLAREVTDELKRSTGIDWHVGVGRAWRGSVLLGVDTGLGPQRYRLVIHGTGGDDERAPIVTVSGGDVAGVRHGVQTLRLIIRQCGRLLPEMAVQDGPAYPVRGYSLDVTRGRIPTMAWLKRWVDLLELYKYNQLQLYVEHSFRFPGMSESWRGTDALSPEDLSELDDYCRLRGIELVPSISTFGHQYVSMRTIGLRSLGELPDDADRPFAFIERQEHHTLNIADPRSFDYSAGLIDAFRPLVRSRRFNIGADETFDLGRGASRDMARRMGTARMYADYVARLCSYVVGHGGEPMLWGDIAVEMPQILGMLPRDVILLNWLYSPDVDATKVRLVAEAGARQYVCPAVQGWNALLPRVDDAWNNIMRLARIGRDYDAEGWLVTDWGDYGHVNDPRMSVAGMVYGACGGWSNTAPERSAVDAGISSLHYGDPSGRAMELLAEASRQTAFGWDDLVRYLELDAGGSLNKDVLAVALPGLGDSAQKEMSVADARRAYLASLSSRLATATECNPRLVRVQSRLAWLLRSPQASQDLPALIVALEGQRLLNDVGVHLGTDQSEDCEDLARSLEEWWEIYIAQWRMVSRESELRRISRLVWACADMLHRRAVPRASQESARKTPQEEER